MFCRKCGKEINDEAVICIHCGCSVKEEKEIEKGSNGIALAGFICSFISPLLGWIFGGVGLSKSKKLNGKGKNFSIAALAISSAVFILAMLISL